MNETNEWRIGSVAQPGRETARGEAADGQEKAMPVTNRSLAGIASATGAASAFSIDPWSLIESVARRWSWLLGAGCVLSVAGLLTSLVLCKTTYTAPAQLIRYESPNAEEVFRPRQLSAQTLANLMRSPELLERVSAQAHPPISPDALANRVQLMPERNNEVLIVAVSGQNRREVVDLANQYAREAIHFTGELQANAAAEVNQFLKAQLVQTDADIRVLYQQLRSLGQAEGKTISGAPSGRLPLAEKYQKAREELVDLLVRYTEAHPLVQAQREKMAILEAQMAESRTNAAARLRLPDNPIGPAGTVSKPTPPAPETGTPSDRLPDLEVIRSQLQSLESGRFALAARQRAAQSFEEHPAGYFRFVTPVALKDVIKHGRRLKVVSATGFGGFIGVLIATALILIIEMTDARLKTASDVERVTRLPVLASLGDLQTLGPDAERNWAFRTWTALQNRLSLSPNHGLICGITSAGAREGRSTWVRLLAGAASQRGFRVLTIATRPSRSQPQTAGEIAQTGGDGNGEKVGEEKDEAGQPVALTTNVLASPAQVSEKLVGPNPQPLVHILLPGWVWNLERRKQWQAALEHWRRIDNIVILVELPPAFVPEAVLLAENLPNLIWLAESGQANAADTRTHLETLRHSRCHLVGAVVNHEPASRLRDLFPRWRGSVALSFALSLFLGLGQASHLAAASPASAGNGIYSLRLVDQTEDHMTATLTMEYSYDGVRGPTARVVPVVGKRGAPAAANWFQADDCAVAPGRGRLSVRVHYRNPDQESRSPLATDTVKVWMLEGENRSVLGVFPFLKTIHWGSADAPKAHVVAAASAQSVEEAGRATPEPSDTAAATVAAPPESPAPRLNTETNLSFSVTTPAKRAAWQERLTLGPGDVLSFSLSGQPELSRSEVFIGPDGRVGFLEAQDVLAAGLTIDELRAKLDETLAKYRRAPRTVVTPVAFRSKKYFVLGEVVQKGVFTLDRPLTIIEAVAQAHGLEVGLLDRNVVELADFSRSFLVRRDQRVPVNFEKLFQEGDLTQNVPLEPGDYLCFPPGDVREVYVLGEVKMPGRIPFTPEAAALRAIADRGGFTDRAWTRRILVVRGSLNRPETFVVNAAEVLSARAPDFRLEARDIVYVSSRPWIKAEELLDTAISAFAQGAVIVWTGGNIGPLIR